MRMILLLLAFLALPVLADDKMKAPADKMDPYIPVDKMNPYIPALKLKAFPPADKMKAFPPADEGMTRHVIHLPKLADESLAKLQLIVGKKAMVVPGHPHVLIGRIEARAMSTVDYREPTRYVVPKLGPAVPFTDPLRPHADPMEGPPKEERFVCVGTHPYFIRYNSYRPVVVYVPKGAEVQYRIWKTGPGTTTANEG